MIAEGCGSYRNWGRLAFYSTQYSWAPKAKTRTLYAPAPAAHMG